MNNQLIEQLNINGYTVKKFTLTDIGKYSVSDAVWNYRDVPHANHVHKLLSSVNIDVTDTNVATIIFQKIPYLFKVPLCLNNISYNNNRVIYYTSFLFTILYITTDINEVNENETSVKTSYYICSPRLLNFIIFPIVSYILKHNNKNLMNDDISMRNRRANLRKRGYQFQSKSKTEFFTYAESLQISINSLLIPSELIGAKFRYSFEINDLSKNKILLFGDSDITGLRIDLSDQNEILIFKRICGHQGSDLSNCQRNLNYLKCQWHGKINSPILIIKDIEFNKIQTDEILITKHESIIIIEYCINQIS
jgi:hypothetical protein